MSGAPRTQAQVQAGLMALVPPGWALPKDPDSNFVLGFTGLAACLADLEAHAAALLPESDPRTAAALLPVYEAILGPGPVDPATLTPPQRQASAWQRWTAQGGASRAFFLRIAAQLGFTATIAEYRPFFAEVNHAEDPLLDERWAFVWDVNVAQPADPRAPLLEAAIRKFAPAQTTVRIRYGVPA